MISAFEARQKSLPMKVLNLFIIFTFTLSLVTIPTPSQAQMTSQIILNLPIPGTMLQPSAGYMPAHVKGLTIDAQNPLAFDFIIDKGESGLEGDAFEAESLKLVKYFLAALTVPEAELWVNLSPYESDRIIPQAFSTTEMGRDLLAQDYILKQLTASLMYPEEELGRSFWNRVYKKAHQKFGTTDIPVDTFNKVWIVPEKAMIYETGANAFIVKSRLKVMLEEDYFAVQKNLESSRFFQENNQRAEVQAIRGVTKEVIREVLIPEIEKEVNEGENFANLRQIYSSLILASWYKRNLKQSLLGQIYVDQNKVSGINDADASDKMKIYNQYVEAFEKGVYNYIKAEEDPITGDILPRKFFSGGFTADSAMMDAAIEVERRDLAQLTQEAPRVAQEVSAGLEANNAVKVVVNLAEGKVDAGLIRGAANEPVFNQPRTETDNWAQQDQLGRVDKAMKALTISYFPRRDFDAEFRRLEEARTYFKRSVSEHGGLKPDENYKEAVSTAFKISRIGRPAPDVYLIGNDEDPVTFGAIFDADINRIFIQKSFDNHIRDVDASYGMRERVILNLITSGSELGKRQAEYNYLVSEFGEDLNQAISGVLGNNTLDDVINEIEQNIIGEWLGQDGRTDKDLIEELGLPQETVVTNRTGLFEQHSNQLSDTGRLAIYNLAINIANGRTNLNRSFRYSIDDPLPQGQQKVRAGLLPFAANPITEAHLLSTLLQAMAITGADTYAASPTKGDYRKPSLEATYSVRLALAKRIISGLTKGLVRVMPELPEEQRGGVNGEEKIIPLLELNEHIPEIEFLYGAGADHFYTFARESDGKTVKFVNVDQTNKKDFLYYITKTDENTGKVVPRRGYQLLLKKLIETEESNIPEEHREIIRRIADTNTSQEEIEQILNQMDNGEFLKLPVLDTVGKLYIIQQEYDPEKRRIIMVNTSRGDQPIDATRDNLDLEIIFNQGLDFDISATKLREGVLHFIETGEFDLEKFEAAPMFLVKDIFRPENRQYLYSLIRQKGLTYSKSIELRNGLDVLFPADSDQEAQRHQRLVTDLKNQLSDITGQEVEIKEESSSNRKESQITVSIGNKNDAFVYGYAVRNGISSQAGGNNVVVTKKVQFEIESSLLEQQNAIISAVQRYVADLNGSYATLSVDDSVQRMPAFVLTDKFSGLQSAAKTTEDLKDEDPIDALIITGTDDIRVLQSALALKASGKVNRIVLSGGEASKRYGLRELAQNMDIPIAKSSKSEAAIMHEIMVELAKQNSDWIKLVDDLNDPEKTILETRSRYKFENFKEIKPVLFPDASRTKLDQSQKKLRVAFLQPGIQALRAQGFFQSVFHEEIENGHIEGMAISAPSIQSERAEHQIIGEYARIVFNAVNKDDDGIRNWRMPKGLDIIPVQEWQEAREVFLSLSSDRREEITDELAAITGGMYLNLGDVVNDPYLPEDAQQFMQTVFGNKNLRKRPVDSVSSSTDDPADAAMTTSSITDRAMTDTQVVNTTDAAMKTDFTKGGIDLNPDMLDLQIKRDANGVPLPIFEQPLETMQIDGFMPVIINIQPIPSIPLMLGIADFPDEEPVDFSDTTDMPFDRKVRLTEIVEMSV